MPGVVDAIQAKYRGGRHMRSERMKRSAMVARWSAKYSMTQAVGWRVDWWGFRVGAPQNEVR